MSIVWFVTKEIAMVATEQERYMATMMALRMEGFTTQQAEYKVNNLLKVGRLPQTEECCLLIEVMREAQEK